MPTAKINSLGSRYSGSKLNVLRSYNYSIQLSRFLINETVIKQQYVFPVGNFECDRLSFEQLRSAILDFKTIHTDGPSMVNFA